MGRGKLKMELIEKEKSRNSTFKNRKEGLIKKLHELTTLCDVSACMIIYGPMKETGVETWPQNGDEVRRIIEAFKKRKDGCSSMQCVGVSEFFEERKRKVEEELVKQRKKNLETKYPSWNKFLSFLNEAELRVLGVKLSCKAEYLKSRIELLKRSKRQQDFDLMRYNMVDVGSSQFHNAGNYVVNHEEGIGPNDRMGGVNVSMNYQYVPPQQLQGWPMMPKMLDEGLDWFTSEIHGFY